MRIGWFKNRYLRLEVLSVLFLLSAMLIADVSAAPVVGQNNGQLVRVRIFTLRNISAERAKEYLTTAQVADTIVVIPNTTALSVAGKPEELVYATVVLKLVDSNEAFDVQMLDVEQGKSMPLPGEIEKKLGSGYSVGSLLEGTTLGATVKTIVDIHKGKLLIISPASQTAKITETVLANLISSKPAIAEPNIAIIEPNIAVIEPNIAIIEPNIAAEPNLPPAITEVEVSVNGKPQTEEDKLLAEFMSELANADTAQAENLKAAELQYQAITAQKEVEPESAKQTQIAESAAVVKSAEKIQEPVAVEQTQTQDANILLTAQTDDTNQAETIEVKQAAIPVIDIPNGDEELTLNLPEKLEIVALIDLVGKYLNLNYLYDEAKVMGSVTIKVQGKLKVRQLYDILENVLKFRGFVMSRRGNLVTIVPVAEALDQDPTFSGDIKAGDVIVTKVFKLQYINAMTAKQLLIGVKLGNEQTITPIVETGSLIITEYAFRMQRIEDLLSLVDVPGPPKEFRLRVLKYTLAESLVPKIQALAEQLGTVSVTVGTTSTTAQPTSPMSRARPIRTPTPTPTPQQPQTQDTTGKTGVFIDFDKRTNRVLMIGLADELAAVNQIIDSLDVPQQDLRSICEYEIQYVDIESVVTALKDFGIIDQSTNTGSSSGGNSFTSSSRLRQQQQQQNPQQPQTMVNSAVSADSGALGLSAIDQPQVVVLESTNSILVNATPEQQLQIARVISYMDREPISNATPYWIYRLENQEPVKLAEVLNQLIEKTIKDKEGKVQSTVKFQEDIVVVPDEATFSLIVYASKKNQDWVGTLIKQLDTRRPQVLIDVSLVEVTRNDVFQFDLDLVTNAKNFVTNNIQLTRLNAATGDRIEAKMDSGTTTGYYSADRIQALLTLVNTKGYGRVLAQPKILVNDNEEGTINTTSQRYVKKETQSASGSTGDTLISTSEWVAYDAKIELKITPQISEGNLLRLEVAMIREDFGTKEAADAPPPKTTSNVTTVVTVPDGSTIILGGLNKLNQSKTGGKTPLLGDIPIAGSLFRNVNNSNEERRLYVFVKANISRPDATSSMNQLKAISKKNQIEFEKIEDKFQKHEDFPGIKPEVVEPLKVLEHDVNEVDANTISE